ncbi:virginiamycin B lyase family protein [Tengunoibacter tsumagoiensis]|uniref:Uncharacterized protein n=1 Tax=Tengunoibacter tsumagoiensis TaxID=2014871 RepID=A0A402A352_9CHLR|nr:hypothetical protein [Tengunoibacter tsumagoiensis]GCE13580.1 hypothetical protein KTT_34390 [Tengunoibacter tsumagoiensis]
MKKKFTKKKILAMGVVLVLLVTSLLVVIKSAIDAHAQAAGISSFTTYSVPGGSMDPWGTAFDSTGRVWVTLPGCDPNPSCPSSTPPGKLALFDPSSHTWVTVVSLPAGYGQPLFVTVDQNGKVWFTMPVTNAIGMYDPVSTNVAQWAIPTASSGPWGIAHDGHGKIWFAEHYGNQIGSFDPSSQTFHEIATPATNSNPYGITVDGSNNVWFAENTSSVALIGEYTSQGTLKEFKIRNTPTGGTGLTPHQITVAPDGKIWWSEGWVSGIGTLDPATAVPGTNTGVHEYFYTPCGGCSSHTSGISTDQQGLVWIDDSITNQYGYIPAIGGSFSLYYANPGSHPHDGMNVDAQNRVWFNEEFANALALAIPSGITIPTPSPTVPVTPTATSSATSTPTPTPVGTPTSWSPLASDTFQRANQALWGTASDGHSWGGDANSQTFFSIAGNTGLVSNTGSTSYSAVLGASATDTDVTLTGSLSAFTGGNFGAVLRWTDGNNWYKAYIDGSSLIIQKKVGGITTILGSTPFTATGGTSYSIHFRATGSTLSANVWPSSSSEPSGWMVSANDSSLSSGYAGLRVLTQGNTLTVSSFTANIPGSGTATATATPVASPTATTVASPTATATSVASPTVTSTPTSGATIATDTFQRANQAYWGTASDGQTWGGDANTQNFFSITNNTGLVSNAGSASYSAVLGANSTNAEVYLTGSLSAFASSNFGAVLRWTDGNNWYKAYIDGSNLIIQKKVGGTATVLSSVPFATTDGGTYSLHFRVSGSTLSANVWASSGTEPGGWMTTATDSSLTSGYCGLRILTQAGTFTVTSFLAKQA